MILYVIVDIFVIVFDVEFIYKICEVIVQDIVVVQCLGMQLSLVSILVDYLQSYFIDFDWGSLLVLFYYVYWCVVVGRFWVSLM